MEFDLVISGARLIDGSGAPARTADVGLLGGRIAAVGDLSQASAEERLTAVGRALAPGFIDSHTHDDGYLLVHPDMTPKVSQGVTTVVTGNCGISLAPLVPSQPPQPLDLLGPSDLFRFASFAAWLDALRVAAPNTNVVPLIGHSTLRVGHMVRLNRAADEAEIAAMRAQVAEAMRAGAFGLSTGTFYPPAEHASEAEIVAVSQPLRGHGIYATHLRDETDAIVPAMQEAFRVGRALGCRVVLSHHKVGGKANHGRSVETLALIDEAAASQPVCLDCHPYPATSTMLRLDRIRQSSRTLVTWSKSYPAAAGRDFGSLMVEFGCDDAETLRRLRPAGGIYFLMDEGDVRRIARHRLCMFGSDGLPFDPHPHPRQWGTFPRVLGRLVREEGCLSLEAAVHKMTGLAAAQYGLAERGLIVPGHHADLVLFDPTTVADRATFEQPVQTSLGIELVLVNGRPVWRDGRAVASRSGQVLRPGG